MTHLIGDIGNTDTKLCVLDKKFKIIKRLNVDTLKIKNQYYFSKDNSWKEEIDEFADIILRKLPIKTGNIYDALKVMDMVEKIYRADKKGV